MMKINKVACGFLLPLISYSVACGPGPHEPTESDSRLSAVVEHSGQTLSAVTTVVPYGASGYKYLDVAQGQSPPDGSGKTFEAPGFDDSGWGDGSAPFGLKSGFCDIESEIKTEGWQENHDLLVRKTFDLPAGVSGLEVAVAIDNDIRVWFNGVDISNGLQVHDGCPTRDSFIFDVPPAAVLAGPNVLAIRARDRGISAFLDIEVRAAAAVDVTPPTLVRVDVDPDTIDLTGDRSVAVTVEAMDGESGVAGISIQLEAPDGSSTIDLQTSFTPGPQATHTFHHIFDEGNTRTGLWRLSGRVTDAAGNATQVVPGADPPVSPGVEVTFCGEDIEPRNGGIKGADWASQQAEDAGFLNFVILHGELDNVRQARAEMDEFLGWDRFLVEHDVAFRTKFCEALRWLPGARAGDEQSRLLLLLTLGTLNNLVNDGLLPRLNYLAQVRGDLEAGTQNERWDALLEAIKKVDRKTLAIANEGPAEKIMRIRSELERLARIAELIFKGVASRASYFGLLEDIVDLTEKITTIAEFLELDLQEELKLAEYMELWQSLNAIAHLELQYIELGTEEQRLIRRLERAAR